MKHLKIWLPKSLLVSHSQSTPTSSSMYTRSDHPINLELNTSHPRGAPEPLVTLVPPICTSQFTLPTEHGCTRVLPIRERAKILLRRLHGESSLSSHSATVPRPYQRPQCIVHQTHHMYAHQRHFFPTRFFSSGYLGTETLPQIFIFILFYFIFVCLNNHAPHMLTHFLEVLCFVLMFVDASWRCTYIGQCLRDGPPPLHYRCYSSMFSFHLLYTACMCIVFCIASFYV